MREKDIAGDNWRARRARTNILVLLKASAECGDCGVERMLMASNTHRSCYVQTNFFLMVCDEETHAHCDDSCREDSDSICDCYNAWLIARGVELTDNLIQVRSPLRKGDPRDKIPEVLRKEWGLMSGDKPIPKGKTICRVPKAACFIGDQTLHMTIANMCSVFCR